MFAKRFTVAAAILAWAAFALPAAAQTAPPATVRVENVQDPAPQPPPAPKKMTALEAVHKAKDMLNAILADRLKTRKQPYSVPNATTAKMTLAVWNRDTDAIDIVGADKSGDSLKITSGPKLPISVSYSAKLESQYALPAETNSLVVGVIYPVVTKNVISKKKVNYAATDLVYVPYNSAFYTPQMLSSGSDYLSFLIQDAYDELRAKGIKSRAYPDKLLADVVDPYLVKSIAVIEHSDTYSLTKQDDQDRAIGRFLVKLATNEEETFHTSVSTAGAQGLVQFIPSTYALMVRTRPDLGLIKDFHAGMADHKNAVKAQVAYIDSDLASMATVKQLYIIDKAKAAEYLAASYNGGSTRVIRAYTAFGDDWQKSHKADIAAADSKQASLKTKILGLLAQINKGKDVKTNKATVATLRSQRATALDRIAQLKKASLKEETVGYVAKLKHAYAMFTAGYFATPSAPSGALPAVAVTAPAATPTATGAAPVAAGGAAGQVCFGDGACVATQ